MSYRHRQLDLRTANPVMAALEGYKAVDNIFETNRERKRAEEDRGRALEDRERNIAWQGEMQAQTRTGWKNEAADRANAELLKTTNQIQFQINQLPHDATNEQVWQIVQQAPKEIQDVIKNQWNPQEVEKSRKAESLFRQGMEIAAQGDQALSKKILIDAANLHVEELNRGTAKEGIVKILSKKVVDLHLHESGGVVPLLEIEGEDKDGKKIVYQEWSTKGQGIGADDPVNIIYPEAAAQVLFNRRRVAEAIDAAQVGMGDRTPLDRQQTKIDAIEKNEAIADISTALADSITPDMNRAEAVASAMKTMNDMVKKSNGTVSMAEAKPMVDLLVAAHDKDLTEVARSAEALLKAQKDAAEKGKLTLTSLTSGINAARIAYAKAMTQTDFNEALTDEQRATAMAEYEDILKQQFRLLLEYYPQETVAYETHPVMEAVLEEEMRLRTKGGNQPPPAGDGPPPPVDGPPPPAIDKQPPDAVDSWLSRDRGKPAPALAGPIKVTEETNEQGALTRWLNDINRQIGLTEDRLERATGAEKVRLEKMLDRLFEQKEQQSRGL